MNEILTFSETNTSVEEILRDSPQMVSLFLKYKTACPGCYLARFCTLKDVITTYGFDRDEFLAELDKILSNQIRSSRRTK